MSNTIAQNLGRLQAARTSISNAITAKGGTVSAGDGLEDFPADIATIPTGSSKIVLPNTKTLLVDDPPQFGHTWSTKTWTGFTSFQGNYIWTDGENIYYSNNTDQYVLDKSTSKSLQPRANQDTVCNMVSDASYSSSLSMRFVLKLKNKINMLGRICAP
jgi:hypothetical protein